MENNHHLISIIPHQYIVPVKDHKQIHVKFVYPTIQRVSLESILLNHSSISPYPSDKQINRHIQIDQQQSLNFYRGNRIQNEHKFDTLNLYQKFQKQLLRIQNKIKPKHRIILSSKKKNHQNKSNQKLKVSTNNFHKLSNYKNNKVLLSQCLRTKQIVDQTPKKHNNRSISRRGISLSSTLTKNKSERQFSPQCCFNSVKKLKVQRKKLINLTPNKKYNKSLDSLKKVNNIKVLNLKKSKRT